MKCFSALLILTRLLMPVNPAFAAVSCGSHMDAAAVTMAPATLPALTADSLSTINQILEMKIGSAFLTRANLEQNLLAFQARFPDFAYSRFIAPTAKERAQAVIDLDNRLIEEAESLMRPMSLDQDQAKLKIVVDGIKRYFTLGFTMSDNFFAADSKAIKGNPHISLYAKVKDHARATVQKIESGRLGEVKILEYPGGRGYVQLASGLLAPFNFKTGEFLGKPIAKNQIDEDFAVSGNFKRNLDPPFLPWMFSIPVDDFSKFSIEASFQPTGILKPRQIEAADSEDMDMIRFFRHDVLDHAVGTLTSLGDTFPSVSLAMRTLLQNKMNSAILDLSSDAFTQDALSRIVFAYSHETTQIFLPRAAIEEDWSDARRIIIERSILREYGPSLRGPQGQSLLKDDLDRAVVIFLRVIKEAFTPVRY